MDIEKIQPSWSIGLKKEFNLEYFKNLVSFLDSEYKNKVIFPSYNNILNVFKLVSFEDVKVVIVGQDPYYKKGFANGLAFSIESSKKNSPSLRNIFKEISTDLNIQTSSNFDLTRWAIQGVFLINSTLTVEENKPLSHKGLGWEIFTDKVINLLNSKKTNLVFILWGKHAQLKCKFIDTTKHLVISSPHPYSFSGKESFFGSKPFSKANDYLVEHGLLAIDWS